MRGSRRRNFVLGRDRNIEITIFWNTHTGNWVGQYTIQSNSDKIGNVSHEEIRKIPGLLRLRFAELKDPKIKEVRKRMGNVNEGPLFEVPRNPKVGDSFMDSQGSRFVITNVFSDQVWASDIYGAKISWKPKYD